MRELNKMERRAPTPQIVQRMGDKGLTPHFLPAESVYLRDSGQLGSGFLSSVWGARRCCGVVPNPKSLNWATWSIRETRFRHVCTFGLGEDVVGCALKPPPRCSPALGEGAVFSRISQCALFPT